MSEVAQKNGIVLTTWVDDIVISGEDSRNLMEPIRKAIAANGLKIAPAKTLVMGSKSEKIVTGVRLGRYGPRAPRRKMSELRAAIFRLASGKVAGEDIPKYKKNLAGRIAYVASINKGDGQKLTDYATKLDVKLEPSPR